MKTFKMLRVVQTGMIFRIQYSNTGKSWRDLESASTEEEALKLAGEYYQRQLNLSSGPRVVKEWTIPEKGENNNG